MSRSSTGTFAICRGRAVRLVDWAASHYCSYRAIVKTDVDVRAMKLQQGSVDKEKQSWLPMWKASVNSESSRLNGARRP